MRPKWMFAALLACGLGWAARAADPPAKEPPPAPEGWVDYAPKDKIFAIWLPKGGKRTERTDTIPVQSVRLRLNVLELQSDGKGKFFARTVLFNTESVGGATAKAGAKGKAGKAKPAGPVRWGPAQAQALAEAMRDLFLKEVKGKVADEKEVKLGEVAGLGEVTGKEYLVTIGEKGFARVRVFVTGKMAHSSGSWGPGNKCRGGTPTPSSAPTASRRTDGKPRSIGRPGCPGRHLAPPLQSAALRLDPRMSRSRIVLTRG